MKENKIICIICSIITIIFLIISLILFSFNNTNDNDSSTINYLQNIALNIFTGTILSSLTALICFNVQKEEKISKLKSNIKKDITKFEDIFLSIEYIYDKDKLHNELINLKEYENNKTWFESFTFSNKEILKSNIEKLKGLRSISTLELQSNIDELLKLKPKLQIKEFQLFKSQLNTINNLIGYFKINSLESNIPKVYKKIQDIIFECQDENGQQILNDICLKDNYIYPTTKKNLIIDTLKTIISEL